MSQTLTHAARFLVLSLLLSAVAACGTAAPTADTSEESTLTVSHTVIDSMAATDSDMEALVAPYRDEMQAEVERVIAHAPEELTEGTPEGTLGNLAADAMLHHARELSERSVDMAFTNNGGLRVPLGPGDITVAAVYELMPFENRMVVLTISGAQVIELAEQLIALYDGEPIAGFQFRFAPDSGAVSDVLVGDAPVDPADAYRLVTSDYLADGGGPPILEGLPREELPMLLREAFLAYFESMGTLTAEIEGRITSTD